jgi:hypothetical protein
MRRRIAAGIAVLALLGLILATAVMLSDASPAPPLRVGMTGVEVDEALHSNDYGAFHTMYKPAWGDSWRIKEDGLQYRFGQDRSGHQIWLNVYFDKNDPFGDEPPRVVSWRVEVVRAPWWVEAKRVMGLK